MFQDEAKKTKNMPNNYTKLRNIMSKMSHHGFTFECIGGVIASFLLEIGKSSMLSRCSYTHGAKEMRAISIYFLHETPPKEHKALTLDITELTSIGKNMNMTMPLHFKQKMLYQPIRKHRGTKDLTVCSVEVATSFHDLQLI